MAEPDVVRSMSIAPAGKGRPLTRAMLLAFTVAAAYYLAARLGVDLRLPPATTSVLWPPNSLLTAVLLLTPPRLWWVCLAAVLPAHVLVEVQAGFPVALVLALFVTNCSEALVAASLLHRWSDAPARFDSLRRVTAFLAAAVLLAPLLTSFADAAMVHLLRDEAYWPVFRRRVFSNALSALTIVPSVVTIVSQGPRWLRESSTRQRLEAAGLAAGMTAAGLAVFFTEREHGAPLPGVPYTSLPFLVPFFMWAAVRFGPGGASLALLTTTLLAIRAATAGWKPFQPLSPEESVIALQVFVTVVGAPLLFLSALIEERRQTTAALGERLRFEELLSRLAAEFLHLASHQMDRAFESGLQQLGQFFGVDRVALRRFTPKGDLKVAYRWSRAEAPGLPESLERSDIPWATDLLLREEAILISDLDQLPLEATRERDLLRRHGVRSLLLLPLVAGRQVLGGLGFVGISGAHSWSKEVVERGGLFANLFASALARKQAEDAVRSSEATKAAVLSSLTSHVAVLDRTGRIVTVNESWGRLVDEGGAETRATLGGVGSDHLEFWRRLAAEGVGEAGAAMAGIAGVLEGSRPSFVLEYSSPAHPDRWYVMTVVPLRAPEGGAVVSLTEVTERKRAELEAQRSRQELAHFLRVSTIGELTTSLAHELNQPLTAILANAETGTHLLKGSRSPASGQLREILAEIADEDRRAGEVIRRLRELLRKGEPQRALLEVNSLVREIVELLASDALIRGVAVRLDLHPGRLTVRGDRVQLQQVLLNILINAMEALAEVGEADPVVLIRTEGSGDGKARISVVDTGPGLRMVTPAGVFEPFYTTKAQGLGMGLSIARSIAEAHGGTLQASNNTTRGATFTVTLPAVDPEGPVAVPSLEPPARRRETPRP
jgi:nitrogen-specific signal transduction histidine kinase/integral membrane sensor domain MASE1/GAF domain-containing protein